MKKQSVTKEQRLAYGVTESARLLGVSVGLVRKLIRERKLETRRIGRRVLVPAEALVQLLEDRL